MEKLTLIGGLLPSVLHKLRYMIFEIPYKTHSGIVKCHKNGTVVPVVTVNYDKSERT